MSLMLVACKGDEQDIHASRDGMVSISSTCMHMVIINWEECEALSSVGFSIGLEKKTEVG